MFYIHTTPNYNYLKHIKEEGTHKMKILLDPEKKYYKAAWHCHSTKSDGAYTVERLKEKFKKHGYSAVG